MWSADHPFKHPVDPAILSGLRKRFADAAAKYPRITFTLIRSIPPWPLIGVNWPQLRETLFQYMGRGERLCIPAHDSPSMGPPFEFFFAEQDALNCYRELTSRVGEQTPLGPYKDWTGTLHQLALSLGMVSFRAPEKRIHCYPHPAGQGWFWAEEHHAQDFFHPVAIVFYWQLADLWSASVEALDLWAKQKADAEGNPPRTRGRRQSCDHEKDRKIAEAWKHAKAAGVSKKGFAKDRNLSLKELNRILDRYAHRIKRS